MMNNYLHQHPLIPTIDGKFLSSTQIWTEAVQEIYNFCQQNSLPRLWVYLWNEWYGAERWFLWLRAGCSNKLFNFKDQYVCRSTLETFLTSRFFICKHLVQQKGTVNSQFFDNVHRHHQYPFLDTSLSQNYNLAQLTSQAVTNIEVNENENTQVYERLYNHLIDNVEKSLRNSKDQTE
ncbi:unnamed protein product [Rhizophagus irregularis]|nr:unnamed protein product [Rhizophagus irregularis]